MKLVQIKAAAVNRDLADTLRKVLAAVEAGDIISASFAAVRADRSVETWTSASTEALLELAAVDRLHNRLHRQFNQSLDGDA